MALKGGYRSWSMSYSDGRQYIDGQWRVISIVDGKVRRGYRWPQFHHVDMRSLIVGTNGVVNNF